MNSLRLLTAPLACLAMLVSAVSADTVHVAPGENLQGAINAAAAGDTVVLKKGVHLARIEIPLGKDGLTLRGQGAAILDGRVPLPDGGPIITVLAADVTIRNLTIRHPRKVGTPILQEALGIFSFEANGLTVSQVKVLNCTSGAGSFPRTGYGILAVGNAVTVENSHFVGCGRSINILGDEATVSRCTIENNLGWNQPNALLYPAIEVTGQLATVAKNRIFDGSKDDWAIQVKSDGALIEANQIGPGSAGGIRAEGVEVTVRKNRVEGQSNLAIGVVTTNGVVENNRVAHGGGVGIADFIPGVQAVTTGTRFTKNTVLDQGEGAFSAFSFIGSNLTVERNAVKGSASTGFSMTFGADNTFTKNKAQDCLYDGFFNGATNTVLDRFVAIGNQGEGIENVATGTLSIVKCKSLRNRADFANGAAPGAITDGGGNKFGNLESEPGAAPPGEITP